MGSLQQQSILKGVHINGSNEKDLFHKLLYQTVANYSNRIAIYYEDDCGQEYTLSYKELDSLANRMARVLRRYQAENASQSFVAVCMKPSHRLLVILLAILKARMAYLPLDAEFPMSRVKHVLQDAQPLMVFIDHGVDTSIYEGTMTKTYEQLAQESRDEMEDTLVIGDGCEDTAIVLYTSGSTGTPKGVLLPYATILNRLQWQWRELPYAADEERCIFKTSLTFVDSVAEIWGPLLQGRTLVVVPKHVTKDPERFIDVLEKHEIQRLVLVPSLLHSLLMYLGIRDKENFLKKLRVWVCSGETLAVALAEQFFATFNDGERILANFYGSTEVMGDVTYHLLSCPSQVSTAEKVPIGRPMDNCIIYVADKDLRLVPQGEVGELIVAGRNLAAGYIRDTDSHKFQDNPHAIDPDYSRIFRTGDYARIDGGVLIYEGRLDSQIKVRGHRVDLTEVEKAVSRITGVDKVVVLCYKPGELSQTLVAFVTLTNDKSTSAQEIESCLRSTLPPYMLPQVFIIDIIPLLTNGKTDRQALLKLFESSKIDEEGDEQINKDYSGVAKEDLAKAQVLFRTVASVIGRTVRGTVCRDANFYELGGNSLNSIYTVTKLADQGYEIGITEFITSKNLGEMLSRLRINTGEKSLKEANNEGHVFEMLNHSHKEDAIEIITESFYSKADLEQWLMPGITREDYRIMMELLWEALVEKDLSFVVKSAKDGGKTIGVGLNFDLWDEPELVLDSKLMIVFEFLEYLEAPIRERKLPKGKGQIIHNFMMTTSSDLNPAENVIMMKEMEDYCLSLAKRKEYIGIFTTNTSPLTQQLGTDVYGYETMLIYQVNKYHAPNGTKPFCKAPDSQLAICSLKMID